jgi:O-antigen ligase
MPSLFAGFNVILYFSYAHLWLWQEAKISPFKPLHCYLFTIGAGVVLMVFQFRRRFRMPRGSSIQLMVWGITVVAMTSLSFIAISERDEVALQGLIRVAEAMMLLLVFVFLLRDEKVARSATYALLIAVLGGVVLNHADFFTRGHLHMSFVGGRAAGMYVNPNISGQMLVFGMVLSVFVLPKRLRFGYCLLVASGVILTFSRGAIVLWAVAMLCLAWEDTFALPRIPSLLCMGLSVALLATSLVAGDWLVAFKSSGLKQYLTSNTENRIGRSFLEQDDYSARTRMLVARRGLQMFLDKPILGYGVGSSQQRATQVSTHNMYLILGVEQGIFGVTLLMALLLILWRAGTNVCRISAILYALSGMFTHNNLDSPAMQVVLALAVVGTGVMREKQPASSRVVSAQSGSAPA